MRQATQNKSSWPRKTRWAQSHPSLPGVAVSGPVLGRKTAPRLPVLTASLPPSSSPSRLRVTSNPHQESIIITITVIPLEWVCTDRSEGVSDFSASLILSALEPETHCYRITHRFFFNLPPFSGNSQLIPHNAPSLIICPHSLLLLLHPPLPFSLP